MSEQKLDPHEKFAQLAETTREPAIDAIKMALKREYRARGKSPSCKELESMANYHYDCLAMQ